MKLKSAKLCMVLALIALFTLSACGKSNNNASTQTPSTPDPAKTAASGGAVKEITFNAVNWSFTPAEIKANVGDTLKLTLNNTQGVHAVQSQDLGVNLKVGETATVKLDKAGTYEFHCSIQCGQGHDNMVGKIIVQ
jgi:cytochrome c oxidase subunit 2